MVSLRPDTAGQSLDQGRLVADHVHACVQDVPLLEGGPQRAVQPVLEVEVVAPLDHVREQVAEERRVLVEKGGELERVLGGDQLVEPHRARRQRGPVPGPELVVGVRPPVAHALEDHGAIIGRAPGRAI